MDQYIVLLWPQAADAEQIEVYRQEICRGCDVSHSLTWPAHLSLFYGIQTKDAGALVRGLGVIAAETPAFQVRVTGLGAFDQSLVYLKIAPCPRMLELQAKVRKMVKATGASAPGYPPTYKPVGGLTAEERSNVEQWGSYYPFFPHITLARRLGAGQVEKVIEAGRRLSSLVPKSILIDRISIEHLGSCADMEVGASETLASFALALSAPTL